MDTKQITRVGVAERYHVSPRTVDRWRARKLISHKKINRLVRFDVEVIDREIKDRCLIESR